MAATPSSSSIVAAAAASADKQAITSMPKETAYVHAQVAALVSDQPSIESLISASSSNGNGASPPSSKELNGVYDSIKNAHVKIMNKRGEVCDRSIRQLAQKRKERIALEREQEAARAEEEAKRAKAERKKVGMGKKRSADEMEGLERTKKEELEEAEEEKGGMPDVGVRGVARQDGVGVGEGESIDFSS